MAKNTHTTNPKAIEAKERGARALELRKLGYSYSQIADKLGYANPSGAEKAVRRALQLVTREPAQELIELEVQRLDLLMTQAAKGVAKGDTKAMNVFLKASESRRRLLGLDAPTKVQSEHSGPQGKPMQHVIAPVDLSTLSTDDLELFDYLLEKAEKAKAQAQTGEQNP